LAFLIDDAVCESLREDAGAGALIEQAHSFYVLGQHGMDAFEFGSAALAPRQTITKMWKTETLTRALKSVAQLRKI